MATSHLRWSGSHPPRAFGNLGRSERSPARSQKTCQLLVVSPREMGHRQDSSAYFRRFSPPPLMHWHRGAPVFRFSCQWFQGRRPSRFCPCEARCRCFDLQDAALSASVPRELARGGLHVFAVSFRSVLCGHRMRRHCAPHCGRARLRTASSSMFQARFQVRRCSNLGMRRLGSRRRWMTGRRFHLRHRSMRPRSRLLALAGTSRCTLQARFSLLTGRTLGCLRTPDWWRRIQLA